MPPTVHPNLPEHVGRAIDVLGSRVRVAIVRSLTLEGTATRAELADRLRLSTSLLQAHLRQLERLEVVAPIPPRSEPGRLRRRYVVDQDELAMLVDALANSIRPVR